MATPQQDTEMEEPQPPLPSMGATPLFQPIPVERDASFTMAAAQVGVDINSDADLQAYLATPLTTRAQVLDTIRHYHVGVIRPEVFNLISQVEQVVAKLDDRILKTQDSMNWLASDCRVQQKRASGLPVVTTGWDTSMSPELDARPATTPQTPAPTGTWELFSWSRVHRLLPKTQPKTPTRKRAGRR